MENNIAFIVECLKADIEKKVGRTLLTPSDFKFLSLQINMECNEQISPHTVMRIWGYVRSKSNPSVHTLSLLSRFLGYSGISHYTLDLNIKKNKVSGFIDTDLLTADMLREGDTIEIKWNPDRTVSLCYLGNMIFRVIENRNSRLSEGVEFQCVSFAKGAPFIANIISTDLSGNKGYIGGKNGGITSITLSCKNSKHNL